MVVTATAVAFLAVTDAMAAAKAEAASSTITVIFFTTYENSFCKHQLVLTSLKTLLDSNPIKFNHFYLHVYLDFYS